MRTKGVTLVELLVVLSIAILLAAILLPAVARAREVGNRSDCALHLKQLGLACKMYAQESAGGLYPPLQAELMPLHDAESMNPTGQTSLVMAPMVRLSAIYPDYVRDSFAVVCPANKHIQLGGLTAADGTWIGDVACDDGFGKVSTDRGIAQATGSYMYFGWATDACGMASRQESLSLIGGKRKDNAPAQLVLGVGPVLAEIARTQNPTLADADIAVPGGVGTRGGTLIHRLREGVQRFAVTDINNHRKTARAEAEQWIMSDLIEAPAADAQGGANVLFMDGHVEFVEFSAKAPVTSGVAQFVETLQPLCVTGQ